MKKTINSENRMAEFIFVTLALTVALMPAKAGATTLDASGGGTFTFNYDSAALGQAAYGNTYGNNGYYLANYWNTAASNPGNSANTSSYYIQNVGSTQISAANLVQEISPVGPNPSNQPAGRNVQGTSANFVVDSTTLAGVTGAQLGITGIQGFYAQNFASVVVAGDFSLAYNPTETASGWYIQNNFSFPLITYDLANLVLTVTDANDWKLSGDLLLASGYAGMIYGQAGANVGTFNLGIGSYAVSAVPVPGAVWLFGSGMTVLLTGLRRKLKVC